MDVKQFIKKLSTIFSSLTARKCRICFLGIPGFENKIVLTNTYFTDQGTMRQGWSVIHVVEIIDDVLWNMFYDLFQIPRDTPVQIKTDKLCSCLKTIKKIDDIKPVVSDNVLILNGEEYGLYSYSNVPSLEVGTVKEHISAIIDMVESDDNVAARNVEDFTEYGFCKGGVTYIKLKLKEILTPTGECIFDNHGESINAIFMDGLDLPSIKEYHTKDAPNSLRIHSIVPKDWRSIVVVTEYISDMSKIYSYRPLTSYIPLSI